MVMMRGSTVFTVHARLGVAGVAMVTCSNDFEMRQPDPRVSRVWCEMVQGCFMVLGHADGTLKRATMAFLRVSKPSTRNAARNKDLMQLSTAATTLAVDLNLQIHLAVSMNWGSFPGSVLTIRAHNSGSVSGPDFR